MEVIIYHNPRCTKSRQTLELLKENGVSPIVVEYLKTPPSVKTLTDIVNVYSGNPRDIIRKNELEYQECSLDNEQLSKEEIIEIMVKNPKLIERPIVIANGKVAVGRPPENVLKIL